MHKVLICGGIGVGKTTVCKMFEELGIPVYYSDDQAKRIMNEDKEVVRAIKKEFGDDMYVDGRLDRKRLADVVFNDEEKLEILNSIAHPAVSSHFDSWAGIHEVFPESDYVIEEAAIGIELGIQDNFDHVIVVTADQEIRIDRVIKRDGCTKQQVLDRIRNQMPDEEKIKHADYVITNDDFPNTKCQVQGIHDNIVGIILKK